MKHYKVTVSHTSGFECVVEAEDAGYALVLAEKEFVEHLHEFVQFDVEEIGGEGA